MLQNLTESYILLVVKGGVKMQNYDEFLTYLHELISIKSVEGAAEKDAPFGNGAKNALILFKTAVMTETAFRGAKISSSGPVAVAVDAARSVRAFEPVRTGETCIHAHAEYPVAEAVHHIGGIAFVVHSKTDLRIH